MTKKFYLMKRVFHLSIAVLLLMAVIVSAGCITNITFHFYVDGKEWDTVICENTNSFDFELPENPPEKDGYSFSGWYFDKSYEKPFTLDSLKTMPLTKDVNLYAYYKPISEKKYRVKLVTNANSVPEVKVYENGKIQEPTRPERENYRFEGWYRSENFFDSDEWWFANDTIYTYADEDRVLTLYAKWTPVKEAPYYLDGYSAEKSEGHISNVYFGDNKLYLVYDIAKIKGTVVSVLIDPVYNTGGTQYSINDASEISNSMTECNEKTISAAFRDIDTNTNELGGSIKYETGELQKLLAGKISVEVSYKHTWIKEKGWENTTTYSDSKSKTQSYSNQHSKGINLDLDNFPYQKWYRYVVKGDCIVKQIFEYDLTTNSVTRIIFDSEVIENSLRHTLECCNSDDYFEIPESLNPMADVKKIDMSELFAGSGTSNDPYILETPDDLLMSQIDSNKYYRLAKTIDLSDYKFINYVKEPSNLICGDYSIIYSSNTLITISSSSEFMKIYNDLSGNYVLMEDIDLTGCTIPEYTVFSGVFDGNGHTISGKSSGDDIIIKPIKFDNPQYYGLFSENDGIIKDLTLSGFSVYGDSYHGGNWVYAGCVAGRNNLNGIISNIKLIDCSVCCHRLYSSIGMVSGINDGIIENCNVNKGLVMGNGDGGGITGQNTNVISGCSVTGNGVGKSDDYEQYKFLYFYRVNVDGGISRSWGGIAGYATSSSKIQSSNVNDLFVYCYFSTEKPANYNSHIGYLVGHNEGSIDKSCSVGSVSQKRNGDYSKETKQYYLDNDGGNGYVGLNTGKTPW